ncbi:MAG: hypothetical protein K2O03_08160, partial [Lachnospiraceae bacterium]|nr:hypothetical protein [Lachnospiraceae bacterium]
LYPEGDSYHVFYWYGDLGDNTGIISKIFDSDFRLKTIIYDEMADMPPKEQRMEGVNYIWGQEGCLLSAQGDVLLSKELFLAAFGNGTDTDCVIEGGETVRENKSSIKRLYQVTYAGETWYVDAARNAYFKEGEERLHFLDEKKAGETCYAAWIQYGWKYFLPNGNPVVAATFKEEPDYISMCEDGSYVLARKTQQGYMVELAVPDDDFCANYQYESSKVKHLGIEYLEPYVVAIRGAYTDKDGGKREEVVIYKKSRAEVFTGEEVYFSQPKNQKTNEYEDVWIVTVYDGKSQTLTQENKVRKLYTYTVVMDGRARFTTPVPGEEVDYACHGGYLQINAGSYTYVYDYEGNQIIKAYNRIMVEE